MTTWPKDPLSKKLSVDSPLVLTIRATLLTAIGPLVEAGFVDYHWVTTSMMQPIYETSTRSGGRVSPQCWVYQECLRRFGHWHHWMGFFDSDEFIVLKNKTGPDLPLFLKDYEEHGGLTVNWMTFGSSGHLTRPTGGVRAAYTKCHPSFMCKTIANTRWAWGPTNDPHTMHYRDGKFAVNEKFLRTNLSVTPSWTGDKIVLNHYVLKSKEEFTAKILRGDGHGSGKAMEFFEAVDRHCVHECPDTVSSMEGRSYLSRLKAPVPGLVLPGDRKYNEAVRFVLQGWQNADQSSPTNNTG